MTHTSESVHEQAACPNVCYSKMASE